MEITIPIIAGILGTLATALASRLGLSSNVKRWIAIAITVILVSLGAIATSAPDTWQAIAAWLASAIAICQVAFAALKPLGLIDWITDTGKDGKPEGGAGELA
jgi:Ca2+/Na+ antiporter